MLIRNYYFILIKGVRLTEPNFPLAFYRFWRVIKTGNCKFACVVSWAFARGSS